MPDFPYFSDISLWGVPIDSDLGQKSPLND